MDKKEIEIAVAYPEKRKDGWFIKALFGPFQTKDEADTFACRADYLEMSKEAPPVTLFSKKKAKAPPPTTPT